MLVLHEAAGGEGPETSGGEGEGEWTRGGRVRKEKKRKCGEEERRGGREEDYEEDK